MLMLGMQGLYAGYLIFFVNSALMISGARGKLLFFSYDTDISRCVFFIICIGSRGQQNHELGGKLKL